MDMDIITQLQVIATEQKSEIMSLVVIISLVAISALLVMMFAIKFAPVFNRVWKNYLHLDGLERIIVSLGICMAVMYGGAKHNLVPNPGADEGITLAYIEYEVTNVVVSASVTNEFTSVDVAWTAGTITTDTPVHVRKSQTNEWTVLTKLNPVITTESTTNHLDFSVSGDWSGYSYWWVGSNTPAVVIEIFGITLTSFVVTSQSVYISWTCDDPRANAFMIECKIGNTWTEVSRTSAHNALITGFFVDKTTQWRVSSTLDLTNL